MRVQSWAVLTWAAHINMFISVLRPGGWRGWQIEKQSMWKKRKRRCFHIIWCTSWTIILFFLKINIILDIKLIVSNFSPRMSFRKCKMLSLTFSSVCEKWVLHTFIVFWTFYDFILWNKNTNWRFECTIDQYYKHFLIVSVHILYYYYYYLYFFQDHHNSRRPLTTSKFSACMHSVTWWL